MRVVTSVAIAAVFAATLAAAAHPLWKHDTIVNLTAPPAYTSSQQWFGRYDSLADTWRNISTSQTATSPTPIVRVDRNPSAGGWDSIRFTALDQQASYYAVGYVEGQTTFDGIYHSWVNFEQGAEQQFKSMPEAEAFLKTHLQWERDHETATPFGAQLAKQLRIVDGLVDGWQAEYDARKAANDPSVANMTRLDWTGIYFISWQDEAPNIIGKYSQETRNRNKAQPEFDWPAMHCSALMKLTESDLFFAHDTWSHYHTMLRQLKTYAMFEGTVTMSGYPGSFSSTDDFYMTSKELAVTETTNGFFNNSLYEFIVPQSVSEFHRVMIANFLAANASHWMQLFAHQNSGTYNNQYMVADMQTVRNALNAGQKDLPMGTFFVAEQIPGLVIYKDQTAFLNKERHWPSYNIPYYPEIYQRSGFAAYDNALWWGTQNYHQYARAVIFKRMQGYVTDAASMFYMMRFNDYERDPASTIPWCISPWTNGTVDCGDVSQGAHFTIASRYDLNPTNAPVAPNNPNLQVGRALFGAIDTKMTSAFMMQRNHTFIAQNGPTSVQHAPFNHTAFVAANPGYNWGPWSGLPAVYDFPPVQLQPV